MISLDEKARQKHCLICKEVYEPEKNATPAEYPYCSICNTRESMRCVKLQETPVCIDGRRSKKLQDKNIVVKKTSGRTKKKVFIVEKHGGKLCLSQKS